jgi:hypothetical protein
VRRGAGEGEGCASDIPDIQNADTRPGGRLHRRDRAFPTNGLPLAFLGIIVLRTRDENFSAVAHEQRIHPVLTLFRVLRQNVASHNVYVTKLKCY